MAPEGVDETNWLRVSAPVLNWSLKGGSLVADVRRTQNPTQNNCPAWTPGGGVGQEFTRSGQASCRATTPAAQDTHGLITIEKNGDGRLSAGRTISPRMTGPVSTPAEIQIHLKCAKCVLICKMERGLRTHWGHKHMSIEFRLRQPVQFEQQEASGSQDPGPSQAV